MLVLNHTQTAVIKRLLSQLRLDDASPTSELEEAIRWLQQESHHVPCPLEQAWRRNLAQHIAKEQHNYAWFNLIDLFV